MTGPDGLGRPLVERDVSEPTRYVPVVDVLLADLLVCELCGSPVHRAMTYRHDEWHRWLIRALLGAHR